MSKKFDESFSEVMKFEPDGLFISRNVFPTKEDAGKAFAEYMDDMGGAEEDINLEYIKESYVRFEPTPAELRDEIGNMAWMVCEKDSKGAQPCWMIK